MPNPEVWLRGSVPGVEPMLQPPVHSFLQVAEDVEALVTPLTEGQLWATPGGAASIAFHCRHLVGSTDRLLTYARGEQLSPEQIAFMKAESDPPGPSETPAAFVVAVKAAMAKAIDQVRDTPVADLTSPREVGRAKLPTTVIGLLFHAAEHATRHAGQISTLVKVAPDTGLRTQR